MPIAWVGKKHVFCSEGMVAGMGCKTLARALANVSLAVFALSKQCLIQAGVIAVQTY